MKVTVRKVFFKKDMHRAPEYGVTIESRIDSSPYNRGERDIYVYDRSRKYSHSLKKLKNDPVSIVYTDHVFEINIPEEFIKVRCIRKIHKKDTEKPTIAIPVMKKEEVIEDLYTKYLFLEDKYYYIIKSNEESITLVDQNLKEVTFEKGDKTLNDFDFNLI